MVMTQLRESLFEECEDEELIEKLSELQRQIHAGFNDHPQEMFETFCTVLVSNTRDEFEEFVAGLDELTPEDKMELWEGFLVRKKNKFFGTPEDLYNFGIMIVHEFRNRLAALKKGSKVG
jgi:hypothetical protein